MKKILSTLFVISSLFAFAQVPQGINYQSIIRNSSGIVLPSTAVTLEFKLYNGLSGSMVYDETHSATTNSFGMVNLVIGQGSPVSGNFSSVQWANGIAYEVYVNSTIIGTRQLFMSVPYTLYAEKAGNASPTPTISINAPNTVTNPSTGNYNISVPSQSLSVSGNSVSISNGNTVVIPAGITYTQGQGIDISGSVISGTANITGIGATTVTGVYPNLVINTPTVAAQAPPTITGAGSATVTSAGNTFTVDVPAPATPTITGAGSANVTSAGNSFTVTTPVPQVYTAGSGIDITSGVITNTVVAVTPTIVGNGATTVTSSGNTFTITSPAAVTPTITNTGIAVVTPTTGNTFNVDVPAPVLSYNQGTKELSITQGTAVTTQTLIGTGSNTISITGTGLATVTPTTGSTFTVSVPNPTLSVGSGSISISNGNTVALPAAITPTLTAGTNISITPTGPSNSYTINAASTSYTGTAGNIAVTGSTINLAPTAITTGTYGNSATNAVPTFSVDNFGRLTSAAQYTPTVSGDVINSINTTTVAGLRGRPVAPTAPTVNQVLAWNGSVWTPSTNAVQTLSLTGSVLSSGPATNSVNLATLPGLWTAPTASAVVTTTSTSFVGIGMASPVHKLDVVTTSTNNAAIHGNNTAVGVAATGVFGENPNNGIGVFGQSNMGKGIWGSASAAGVGVYGESVTGDASQFILSSNSTAANAVHAETNGQGAVLFAKSNYTPNPLAARFIGNVDIQNPGSATGRLINAVQTNSVSDGFALDIANSNNTGTALQVTNQGKGTAGYFNINNATNGSPAASGTTNGLANGGYFEINNPSSNAAGVEGRVMAGSGNSSAVRGTNVGSDGYAAYFSVTNAANTQTGLYLSNAGQGQGGFFENSNSSSFSSALYAQSVSKGPSISAVNTNTSNAAAHAIAAQSNLGSAVYATSSGSTAPTVYVNNGGLFDGIQAFASNSRAVFAQSSSNGTAAVEVNNTGTGVGLSVYKSSGTTNGNVATFANGSSSNGSDVVFITNDGAGSGINVSKTAFTTAGNVAKFTNSSSSNGADVIYVINSGAGAALHAISASSSTLSLWADNGHLKSTQAAAPGITTVSTSISFSGANYTATNATDVKGSLLAVCTTTSGASIYAGSTITFRVTFSKQYSLNPTVVLTPTTDLGGLSYFVSNITGGSFNITVKNGTASTIIPPSLNLSFNYFVIE